MLKVKATIAVGLLFLLSPLVAEAQQTSYNYTHALEALQNNDYATGKAYLQKELSANAKNGYAWALMCAVYANENKADSAFIAVDNTLRLVPKSDEATLVKAYSLKAKLWTAMEKPEQVLETYNEGVKRLPKNVTMLRYRGDYFNNELEDYARARSDYQRALTVDPGNLDVMCNIGDTYTNEDKLEKGLEWYNKVLAVDPSHAEALLNRAAGYCYKDNYDKGIDDLLTLVKADNISGFRLLLAISDSVPVREIVTERINRRMKEDPKEELWPYTLGSIYSNAEDHPAALKAYQQAFDISKDAGTANSIAKEYYFDNYYADAEKWIIKAEQLARDSSLDVSTSLETHGNILYDQGKYEAAVKQYTASLDADNSDANVYYERGLAYLMWGKRKEALKDMDSSLELADEGTSTIYLMRGWLRRELGMNTEAQGDFRKAVEQDSVGMPTASTFISQHFLGIDKTARESVGRCLAETENRNDFFDAACFYALLGDKVMAVRQLELSIEKGYNSWPIMRDHPWLQSLHGYADYEKLIKGK
ncbi:MAG: tetratricopeptide repeat protein [Prevotella sp.]|nr:tetratricopeptide repeat protein [Prevotella sp.]